MNLKKHCEWRAALLAAIGVMGVAAIARAGGTEGERSSEVVKYGDLDLSSPAGALALHRRIESASERVCGSPFDERELSVTTRSRVCEKQATERAVRAVHSNMLSSVHLALLARAEKPTIPVGK